MMRSALFTGGLLVAVSVLSAFAGGEIIGPARVVDGDTLVIGEQHIRLDGIDAPETDQVCLDAAGQRWTCGIAARDQLARRIGTASVSRTVRIAMAASWPTARSAARASMLG
jgi:endonuclease YncB( thermonuclease family)